MNILCKKCSECKYCVRYMNYKYIKCKSYVNKGTY